MKIINVAVAISSRFRNNNEISLKSIVNYFNYQDDEIKIKVDYFVHLNRKKCNILDGKQNFSQDIISSDEEQSIIKILNPKKIIIEEDYTEIKDKIANLKIKVDPEEWIINQKLNKDYQRLYPYHSQEESIKLIDSYEKENNFTYDLIFKLRPDLYVEQNIYCPKKTVFNFIENYKKQWSTINTSWANVIDADKSIVCLGIEIMNGHIRFSDFAFYGTSKSVKLYTYNFIENYIEYYLYLNSHRKENIYVDNYLTPESFITYPISKYKMNLHGISFFKYVCIRKNYKIGADFDQLVELFYQHEEQEFKKLK